MRTITLHLPDDKYPMVMELLADLGIEVETDIEIPEWQKNIVRERIAAYEADPSIAIPWKDVRGTFDLDAK